jgi:tRNA (Thr-GGU) A37 N-methylase
MANETIHLRQHKSWHEVLVEILDEWRRLLAELEIVRHKTILMQFHFTRQTRNNVNPKRKKKSLQRNQTPFIIKQGDRTS